MDRIKLKVFGLSYQSMSQTGAYALILAEENDAFRIPIIIGICGGSNPLPYRWNTCTRSVLDARFDEESGG